MSMPAVYDAHTRNLSCPHTHHPALTQAPHVTQVPKVVGAHQAQQHVVVLLQDDAKAGTWV